jgi:Ras-related protein Rab-7A
MKNFLQNTRLPSVHVLLYLLFMKITGADFLTKQLLIDDKAVTLQVWDTAGQEVVNDMKVHIHIMV